MGTVEWGWLALSAAAGAALGFFYFGGLWLTVQRIATARHPGSLILCSFLVRMAALLAVLYWIATVHFTRLLAAMLGLIAVRLLLTRWWGPEQQDGNHA
jgi:F1F0 ATPase subunit 2